MTLSSQNNEHVPAHRMTTIPLPDGEELVLCSFAYADWQHVKSEALRVYKRDRIKTITDNADLLPEEQRAETVRRAFQEAQDITLDDLPVKTVIEADDNGDETTTEMDYVTWWLSLTIDGKIFAAWLSARRAPGQESITRNDIVDKLLDNPVELEEAAQEIGKMSTSEIAKNSPSPESGAA
jgi:hypothetical protein